MAPDGNDNLVRLTERKAAFARRCGLSAARISQLAAEGLPVTEGGEIPIDEALDWMARRLDRGRQAKAKPVVLADSHSSTGPASAADDEEPDSLTEARRLHELVKIERAKLALARDRNDLIPRAEAARLIQSFARSFRDALTGMVASAAQRLAAEIGVDAAAMFSALDREIRDFLGELTAMELPNDLR
jgi:hypothetical protein